ncbi:MAG: hypothetical protein HZY73_11225 [Micropruina sp.]|nr:MAG: hypothetical protein HZY73_11225 [Micropruina sp.]
MSADLVARRGRYAFGDRVGSMTIVDRDTKSGAWILECERGHFTRRRSPLLDENPDLPCRKCLGEDSPWARPASVSAAPIPQPIDAHLLESLDLRLRVSARAIAESLDYPSVRSLAHHLARTGHAPLGRLLAAMEKGGQP